jgi:type IX secretion system PorP/SprF family membrane protein
MKKLIIAIIIAAFGSSLSAQDIHFSQFNNTPLTINPALTGAFNGSHRLIANYKSQWWSIDKTYLTYGLSYDLGILRNKMGGGFLGLGLQIYNDMAGVNKMGLTQENISLAYHLPLNKSNLLSVGLQSGFTQRRTDNANMEWASQYDPSFADGHNAALNSGEPMSFSNINYGEVSAGILYSFNKSSSTLSSSDNKKFQMGVALYHINRPKQTYFEGINKRLFMKMAVHMNAFIGFKNSNFALVPSAIWYRQGPCNEILAGTLFRFNLNGASHYTGFVRETALSIGGYYRVNDAVIAAVQFEWKNFLLGMTYDVNTSSLSSASKYAGGLEVSLRYQFPMPDVKNNALF